MWPSRWGRNTIPQPSHGYASSEKSGKCKAERQEVERKSRTAERGGTHHVPCTASFSEITQSHTDSPVFLSLVADGSIDDEEQVAIASTCMSSFRETCQREFGLFASTCRNQRPNDSVRPSGSTTGVHGRVPSRGGGSWIKRTTGLMERTGRHTEKQTTVGFDMLLLNDTGEDNERVGDSE